MIIFFPGQKIYQTTYISHRKGDRFGGLNFSRYSLFGVYEQLGIRMRIDEEPASPMQIVTAHMLKEENNYMRDYVWDEKGKIRELVFHNIKSK